MAVRHLERLSGSKMNGHLWPYDSSKYPSIEASNKNFLRLLTTFGRQFLWL
jgi:hypothetical protein